MAEKTPPGPKTSGRVAGVAAAAAILVGGYYGLVVRPASTPAPEATSAGATKAPDAAPVASDAKPADSKPTEAAAAAAAKPAEKAEAAKDEAAIPTEGSVPSFDIVRVEPTGETVVAGLAAPKSKVELMDGSAPIATAEANERGEWAMAIEKPLSPGTHDLSIRTTSADKKTESLSEQSVAVQVQEPGKGEALVVLNTPDAASKILQKPEVAGETQVAAAATPSAPAGTETPATPENAAAAPAAPDAAARPDTAVKPDAVATASKSDAAATPEAASQPDTAAKPDAVAKTDAPATPDAPANADTLAEADKAANPDTKPGVAPAVQTHAMTAEQPASMPDTKSPDTKTAEVTPPAAAPQVTVDAVEVEDGKTFVAGSAKTSAPVRVYVDEKPIGEAKPGEGGRWLLETPTAIEPGRRVVRADQVEPDSGKVVSRAEVPFERTADVAALSPVVAGGGGAGGASADGNVPAPQNVIIRRGDNLWSISRRLYGRGIRFSTIYAANDDQIRNPNLIYPGQTFVLPTGDANWTN
ncbi:LysM peptidoglycan-binding domain-containing protein [Kaistia terrae]|uniref:LysM peptidoglycan-binding domain-containing protein n=1 Tax=Kaistia terrae TaxID=537017 RepID=A0ABW0PSZ7_9HYPH|nr:LysM peptidoglycan-binding domain-containing protein [Kaistia terrae]MCX5577519.1 LysM peptidoglycan-binding domain-containing protein [Kaistia terrae]